MGLEPIQKRSELFSPNQLDTPFVFFYVFTRFSQISSGLCIYCTYHVSTALYNNVSPLLSSLFKRLSTRFSQVSSGVYIYLLTPHSSIVSSCFFSTNTIFLALTGDDFLKQAKIKSFLFLDDLYSFY